MIRATVQTCPCSPPTDPPAPDEVHLWVIDPARPPADPAELFATLTPLERDRAARYRAARVRDQFITCRGLLRWMLGGYLGVTPRAVPITYHQAGKPVLAADGPLGRGLPPLDFNLSHTEGLAVIAVGRRRIGVDVERVRTVPDADGLVDRFFSPAERAAYRGLVADHRPAAFLRGWTCKEAVIKAVGIGVLALDGFDVEMDPVRPPTVLAVRHEAFIGTPWAVGAWEPAAGYAAAVAIEAATAVRIGMEQAATSDKLMA